jgi:hypothetical protein
MLYAKEAMSVTEKLQRTLDSSEEQFLKKLRKALVEASDNGHSQLFRSEIHNQHSELAGRTDVKTNELVEEANQIIELRRHLGEWPESSSAHLFLKYCEEFNDIGNQNRAGVQKHAKSLLQAISI